MQGGGVPPDQAAVDPADLPGVEVTYFAFKSGGEGGKAVGLFRVASDDEAEVLTLERFTQTGEWEDDPTLIDDLHQPGVYSVDENEAQSIQSQILGAQP